MSNHFRYIVPAPQPDEYFAAYQATSQFYREVQSRAELQRHCEWYYTTAKRHRQELKQMQGELNILGWFRRQRH